MDCDILVTGPFKKELLSYLDEYDFAMQQNYIAGIWGVNCNQRSIDFFDRFVKLIESIPAPARPNGYPQFELCDFIDICAEEGTLSVLELPEKFGFLTKDTVIYHAINAGMSLPAKAITLFFATCFLQQAWGNNFDILDDEEKEAFFKPRAHNTLNFHSGFKESDRELLNSHDTTKWWYGLGIVHRRTNLPSPTNGSFSGGTFIGVCGSFLVSHP